MPELDVIGAARQQDNLKPLGCRDMGRTGIISNKNIADIQQYREVRQVGFAAQVNDAFGAPFKVRGRRFLGSRSDQNYLGELVPVDFLD